MAGWAVLAGHTKVQDPHINFRNAFAGSSHSGNDVSSSILSFPRLILDRQQYATAMLKILWSYYGWSNVNYVMNNVKDPVRTLKIAGPLALTICAVLYILANVAYFA